MDATLARIEKMRKDAGYPNPTIFIKGKNRIQVFMGTQEYLVPSWFSSKGNLCFKIGGRTYVKKINGEISSVGRDGKWHNEEFTQTRATAITVTDTVTPNEEEVALQERLIFK